VAAQPARPWFGEAVAKGNYTKRETGEPARPDPGRGTIGLCAALRSFPTPTPSGYKFSPPTPTGGLRQGHHPGRCREEPPRIPAARSTSPKRFTELQETVSVS